VVAFKIEGPRKGLIPLAEGLGYAGCRGLCQLRGEQCVSQARLSGWIEIHGLKRPAGGAAEKEQGGRRGMKG